MKSVIQRMLKESELCNVKDYAGHDVWLDCTPGLGEIVEECKVELERLFPNEQYRIVLIEG